MYRGLYSPGIKPGDFVAVKRSKNGGKLGLVSNKNKANCSVYVFPLMRSSEPIASAILPKDLVKISSIHSPEEEIVQGNKVKFNQVSKITYTKTVEESICFDSFPNYTFYHTGGIVIGFKNKERPDPNKKDPQIMFCAPEKMRKVEEPYESIEPSKDFLDKIIQPTKVFSTNGPRERVIGITKLVKEIIEANNVHNNLAGTMLSAEERELIGNFYIEYLL